MIYSYNKSQRDALFLNFILIKNSTCFRQTYYPSSGVSTLYTQGKVFVMLVMLTASEFRMDPDLASSQLTCFFFYLIFCILNFFFCQSLK